MGVLHETGHALYEQNLPQAWSHWPLGKARGMAVHESQSLFVEKQIGRNPAFWRWALPLVERHLGESLERSTTSCAHVHRVERGLIRVDADEVTYPLHVILRYELERRWSRAAGGGRFSRGLGRDDARLSRAVDHRQLRGRADAGRALAGRRLRLLPDLHAGRDDGGAAMGGDRPRRRPAADGDSANGRFEAINDWRRQQIWSQGSRYSTPELLERATGEKLNAEHFTDHCGPAMGQPDAA